MITKQDTPTDLVIRWLTNDPDQFNFAAKLVKDWQDEGTEFEDVISDLDSYVCETLDNASPYSAAGACRKSLTDEDLTWVDWSTVLEKLTED